MKSNHKSDDSPKHIAAQLREMLAEAEKLTEHTENGASDILGNLRDRFEQTKEKMSEVYDNTRERVVTGAKKTDKFVRSHPYESVAIALGVGLLVGAFAARRSSSED